MKLFKLVLTCSLILVGLQAGAAGLEIVTSSELRVLFNVKGTVRSFAGEKAQRVFEKGTIFYRNEEEVNALINAQGLTPMVTPDAFSMSVAWIDGQESSVECYRFRKSSPNGDKDKKAIFSYSYSCIVDPLPAELSESEQQQQGRH